MIPSRITPLLAGLTALALMAPQASNAEWSPNGSPLAPRLGAVVAADGTGGVFAATGYPDQFTWLFNIDMNGVPRPAWPAAGRELVPGVAISEHNTIAPILMLPDDAGGSFLLTAEQIGYTGSGGFLYPVQFYVHRRTASGEVSPGWDPRGVLVSAPVIDHTFEVRHLPTMIHDEKGGVLVAWLYNLISIDFMDPSLHVQRISGAGVPLWGDDGVAVQPAKGVATLPTLVADGTGGGFVFWGQYDEARTRLDIHGQHLGAAGTALWLPGGRAVSSGEYLSIDQAAPPDGGWIRQFYSPAIAAAPDGDQGAIVGWIASTGTDMNVYATRVTERPAPRWREDRLVCAAPGPQASLACVASVRPGVVFAWRDGRGGDDVSIRAQWISPQGQPRWTRDGALVADGPGDRGPFTFVNDGRDALYFGWTDPRLGGQVIAQRLLASGHRAPGWPRTGLLVGTRDSGDPNTGSLAVRLTRSIRGSAIATWSDASAGSLAMRLTARGPVASPATPPLAPPQATGAAPQRSFAFAGVTPNPVRREAVLRFSLSTGSSVSLELFDVSGRRVWSRDVSALGPGEHVLPLADGRRLPAGVYLARLLCGTSSASRRVVILP